MRSLGLAIGVGSSRRLGVMGAWAPDSRNDRALLGPDGHAMLLSASAHGRVTVSSVSNGLGLLASSAIVCSWEMGSVHVEALACHSHKEVVCSGGAAVMPSLSLRCSGEAIFDGFGRGMSCTEAVAAGEEPLS